jgi:ABC-type lipoprotein export system ATPase subunit
MPLSTGQRRLIALTRAVVHEPAVLLLRRGHTSIDGACDAALRAALHHLATHTGTGILTVAHRLSTARQAGPDHRHGRRNHRRAGTAGPPDCRGRGFSNLVALDLVAPAASEDR